MRLSWGTGSGIQVLILALTSTSHLAVGLNLKTFMYVKTLLEILWIFSKLPRKVTVCITMVSLRNPFIYLPINHIKHF